MKTTDEVLALLRQALPRLQATYPIRSLALVGSYARGEQTPQSDVDLVVELTPGAGMGFIYLAQELEALLGLPVDLISAGGIKPTYQPSFWADAIHVLSYAPA